ncbi:MAG: hypothetical protein PUP91_19455 [Rhizonema sp. PD37]|nr:hypothetical protein [Rhizonema sp. PD37]
MTSSPAILLVKNAITKKHPILGEGVMILLKKTVVYRCPLQWVLTYPEILMTTFVKRITDLDPVDCTSLDQSTIIPALPINATKA